MRFRLHAGALTSAALAATVILSTAMPAEAAVINIGPADDLIGAVNNLKPGDELVLAGGTYNLTRSLRSP
jgi:hypothetical protein